MLVVHLTQQVHLLGQVLVNKRGKWQKFSFICVFFLIPNLQPFTYPRHLTLLKSVVVHPELMTSTKWICNHLSSAFENVLKLQHSPVSHTHSFETVISAVDKTSDGHCMRTRVRQTYEDYHINLDKSSSQQPTHCREQIKALIYVKLLHAMSSNSNQSALSAKIKYLNSEI